GERREPGEPGVQAVLLGVERADGDPVVGRRGQQRLGFGPGALRVDPALLQHPCDQRPPLLPRRGGEPCAQRAPLAAGALTLRLVHTPRCYRTRFCSPETGVTPGVPGHAPGTRPPPAVPPPCPGLPAVPPPGVLAPCPTCPGTAAERAATAARRGASGRRGNPERRRLPAPAPRLRPPLRHRPFSPPPPDRRPAFPAPPGRAPRAGAGTGVPRTPGPDPRPGRSRAAVPGPPPPAPVPGPVRAGVFSAAGAI